MIVRVMLVQIPEELIEPLFVRQPGLGRTDISQAPFSDQRCSVPGLLQNSRNTNSQASVYLFREFIRGAVASNMPLVGRVPRSWVWNTTA